MTPNNSTLHLTVLTLFPDLIKNYLGDALLSKAILQKKIEVTVVSLRLFSEDHYHSVDDTPFGGGDGMVFKASVLEKSLNSILQVKKSKPHVIYLSPQGKTWNHQLAKDYANRSFASTSLEISSHLKNETELKNEIILICGRYAGIDQRFIKKYVDEEISIGDYVLSGGELAALVLIESISRYIPGVLGSADSAQVDSFENNWLEAPQFTKPQNWNDLQVPSVLTSGHHQKIADWKKLCGLLITFKKRPDLFRQSFQKENIQLNQLIQFYKSLSVDEKSLLQIENLDLESFKI